MAPSAGPSAAAAAILLFLHHQRRRESAMSAVKLVNPNADVIGQRHALHTNIQAASWLAALVKSNLGPKGTLKVSVASRAVGRSARARALECVRGRGGRARRGSLARA
jgi:hypothetical protein